MSIVKYISTYTFFRFMSEYICSLLKIVAKYGVFSEIHTSTIKLANIFGLSQQSASRILIDMEKEGIIQRTSSAKGLTININKKGISMLHAVYNVLEKEFRNIEIKGKVRKGLGEGKYYITSEGYQEQFKKLLGMNPYAGTLNVEVDTSKILAIKSLKDPVEIRGFQANDRTFGGLHCYKCMINNKIKGWVVFAERTTHPENIIEIIAEECLRDVLNIKEDIIITC